jgi:hypothetical protein
MLTISCVAKQVLASEEGLGLMEFVCLFLGLSSKYCASLNNTDISTVMLQSHVIGY